MTFEGKDTIVNELFNSQYKLVVYKDSMSCTPCYIETLSKWNRILNKYNKDVLAIFSYYHHQKKKRILDYY